MTIETTIILLGIIIWVLSVILAYSMGGIW